MAAPTAAAARGGAPAAAPLTSCVPQVDAPRADCPESAVHRRPTLARHGLHSLTSACRALPSSRRAPRADRCDDLRERLRPNRELRGRLLPNRDTLQHMPIFRREEDRATPDLATNHHAHCCRSGRQKCTCSCRPRAWCAVTHRHRAHPCRSDRRTCSCDSRRSARHAIAHHRPSRKPQPPSPALPPLRLCLRLSSCLHSHPRLGQNRCSCSSRFWAARAAAHTRRRGRCSSMPVHFPQLSH